MSKRHQYECVQPELGEELWRLQQNGADLAMHEHLMGHVSVCDSCRLVLATGERLKLELADGGLTIDARRAGFAASESAGRFAPVRILMGVGVVSLAATLLLIFLLPPESIGPEHRWRDGDEAVEILRPVEGEMLLTETPRIVWTPIEGATGYSVRVEGVDNSFSWTGTSSVPEMTLPAEAELPVKNRLLAVVEPVPADLLPPGELSVTFTRTGLARFAIYRMSSTPLGVQTLGVAGLIMLILGLGWTLSRRRGRRPSLGPAQ